MNTRWLLLINRSSKALDDHLDAVLIDLSGITFCDSSGIAVLDEQYGAAADRGIPYAPSMCSPG
ncbi:STAS domain-containing protein [Actinoplanes sichuanensis]|uniref:STAS domain-containing protein n=1 Tax=Actinoplanes sichuanensis TaxID=512349 RepID=A0ABW4A1I6_9ACTN